MIMPEPAPRFLKYTSADSAKKILENGSVRYSAPRTLNDPNDCQLDLDWGFGPDELRKAAIEKYLSIVNSKVQPPYQSVTLFTWLLEAFRNNRERISLTDAELMAQIEPALVQGWENMKKAQPAFNRHIREAWLDQIKVFCVSEVPDQPLMWTHYADQHRGVAIQLGFPDGVDNLLRLAKPVTYRETPPALATLEEFIDIHFLGKKFDPEQIWTKLFFTKHIEFKYEREWRVTLPGEAPNEDQVFIKLHPREIEAVILGAKISAADAETVITLARQRYPHARVLKAKLIGYRIEFGEI